MGGSNALWYALAATVVVSLGTLVWVLFDQRKQRELYEERLEVRRQEEEARAAAEALEAARIARLKAEAEARGEVYEPELLEEEVGIVEEGERPELEGQSEE